MRSLARDFSSSRRAPPKAASKPYLSSACFSPSVFMMSVWRAEPWLNGLMPRSSPSWLTWTMRSSPSSRAVWSRKRDHLAELPGGVDMQQREWRPAGMKGLARQMQHHRRILADGIEHHRLVAFGRDLADDVDRFGLPCLCGWAQPPRSDGRGRSALSTPHRGVSKRLAVEGLFVISAGPANMHYSIFSLVRNALSGHRHAWPPAWRVQPEPSPTTTWS